MDLAEAQKTFHCTELLLLKLLEGAFHLSPAKVHSLILRLLMLKEGSEIINPVQLTRMFGEDKTERPDVGKIFVYLEAQSAHYRLNFINIKGRKIPWTTHVSGQCTAAALPALVIHPWTENIKTISGHHYTVQIPLGDGFAYPGCHLAALYFTLRWFLQPGTKTSTDAFQPEVGREKHNVLSLLYGVLAPSLAKLRNQRDYFVQRLMNLEMSEETLSYYSRLSSEAQSYYKMHKEELENLQRKQEADVARYLGILHAKGPLSFSEALHQMDSLNTLAFSRAFHALDKQQQELTELQTQQTKQASAFSSVVDLQARQVTAQSNLTAVQSDQAEVINSLGKTMQSLAHSQAQSSQVLHLLASRNPSTGGAVRHYPVVVTRVKRSADVAFAADDSTNVFVSQKRHRVQNSSVFTPVAPVQMPAGGGPRSIRCFSVSTSQPASRLGSLT